MELLVTDLITKHDVTVNEELPGRCHFCFGAASPAANFKIELSDLRITTRLSSLAQQVSYES